MTKSCRAPANGAHHKGCCGGRMSTAGGVQSKECVRRMCTTEGYVTVKNCVTLHVLSSSLPGKGREHAVCNLKSDHKPGNGNVKRQLNVSFFLCDIEK
jgi:hypothetical protein